MIDHAHPAVAVVHRQQPMRRIKCDLLDEIPMIEQRLARHSRRRPARQSHQAPLSQRDDQILTQWQRPERRPPGQRDRLAESRRQRPA